MAAHHLRLAAGVIDNLDRLGDDLPIRQTGDVLMRVPGRECWGSPSLLSEPIDEMRADAVGVQSPSDEVSGTHPSPPRPLPE